MNLLPRSHAQFQLQSYWDQFFSKRSTPFEWYGEYTDLCHVLHKYIKPGNRTLVVGCGNSKLSEDLYDVGFVNIINIDISEVVIKKMSARNAEKRPQMSFTQMDMLSMSFDNESFDCVLDKGTLDAIYSSVDDVTVAKVEQMWLEVERVLKVAGRYVCITLAQEHILDRLLQHFSSGWLLRVHKVVLGGGAGGSGGVGGALPVMVFVMTKMTKTTKVEGRPSIKVLEVVEEDGKCVRCEGVEGVREFVKGAQQYAMLLHHLQCLHPGDPGLQLQLWSPTVPDEPRYSFTVIDQHRSKAKNGPFAVFLVPQGRETEWLFSTDGGHIQLAQASGYQRLVVVSLHRGHTYGPLEEVKEEVSSQAVSMLQDGVPSNVKLPILTTGEGVGCRVCLYEGTSAVSGRFMVEECGGEEGSGGGEGVRVRRLVFLATPHLAQTEMRTRAVKRKKSSKAKKRGPASSAHPSLQPDHAHLCFAHHRVMVAALALGPRVWAGEEGGGRVLVVGLGGGALPAYIHRHMPQVYVEVVELDPVMAEVAQRWFGFTQDKGRMTVRVEDGVGFIKKKAATTEDGVYTAVILDVDSKDLSKGMSSPPLTFVEPHSLTAIRSLLKENGLFMTNVAARNVSMKEQVYHTVHQIFPTVASIPLEEDVNEVLVGLMQMSHSAPRNGDTVETRERTQHQNHSEDSTTPGSGPHDSLSKGIEKLSLAETSIASDGAMQGTTLCSEGVKRRVGEMVKVIGECGGDLEGVEEEMIEFLAAATVFNK